METIHELFPYLAELLALASGNVAVVEAVKVAVWSKLNEKYGRLLPLVALVPSSIVVLSYFYMNWLAIGREAIPYVILVSLFSNMMWDKYFKSILSPILPLLYALSHIVLGVKEQKKWK